MAPKASGKRWRLACIYSDANGAGRWGYPFICVLPPGSVPMPVRSWDYDHPPTNKDVYDFMERAFWGFTRRERDGPIWRDENIGVIDASVCVGAWAEVIGEKPTQFYPQFPQQ